MDIKFIQSFKCTDLNQTCHSINVGSLKITTYRKKSTSFHRSFIKKSNKIMIILWGKKCNKRKRACDKVWKVSEHVDKVWKGSEHFDKVWKGKWACC